MEKLLTILSELHPEVDFETEWNGRSVFTYESNINMNADGTTFDVEVELLEGEEDDDWDDEDEEEDD